MKIKSEYVIVAVVAVAFILLTTHRGSLFSFQGAVDTSLHTVSYAPSIVSGANEAVFCDSSSQPAAWLVVVNVPSNATVDMTNTYAVYDGVRDDTVEYMQHPYMSNALVFGTYGGVRIDYAAHPSARCGITYHIAFIEQQQTIIPQPVVQPPVSNTSGGGGIIVQPVVQNPSQQQGNDSTSFIIAGTILVIGGYFILSKRG